MSELRRIGEYEVVCLLGKGGMGEVYLGQDNELNRQVALKLLVGWSSTNSEQLKQEARKAAGLSHPNIIPIFDFGIYEPTRTPYLVMPYLKGVTLAEHAAELEPVAALGYLYKIASALDYAHSKGIVHSDIKPANVFIETEFDRVLLLDFGIARSAGLIPDIKEWVTGTIAYMSPEQINHEIMKGWSDQFSLGIIAFELLVGFHPFVAETEQETIQNISECQWFCDHMPKDQFKSLGPIFYRVFAQQPEDRFPSCWEFVDALAEHFGVEATSTVTEITGRRRTSSTNTRAQRQPRSTRSQLKTYFAITLASAVFVIVVLGIFAMKEQGYLTLPKRPGYEPIEKLKEEIVHIEPILKSKPEFDIDIKLRSKSIPIGSIQIGGSDKQVLILLMDAQQATPAVTLILQFESSFPHCASLLTSYSIEFNSTVSPGRTSLFRNKKKLPPGEVFTISCDSRGNAILDIEGAFPGIQSSWKIHIRSQPTDFFRWRKKVVPTP